MRTKHAIKGFVGGPARQKGMISTLIALIVLVVTLIAVAALMHSVDTSNTIAGSMAFRQGVLQEAELAYQDAKLMSVYAAPASDKDLTPAYHASVLPASTERPDIPQVLFDRDVANVKHMDKVAATGNDVYYVVERICPTVGPATPTTCIVPALAISSGTSSNGTSDPGIPFNTTGSSAAYRLTVRVDGPRGATAYVQTILR